MEGITPVLDEHAIWTASQGRALWKHIKKNPDVVNLSHDPSPNTYSIEEPGSDDEDSSVSSAKEITEKWEDRNVIFAPSWQGHADMVTVYTPRNSSTPTNAATPNAVEHE